MNEPATVVTLPRRPAQCVLRDGRFLDPCARASREPIVLVAIVDPRTQQPSRSFLGLWSEGQIVPLCACPYCGQPLEGAR